MLKDFKAFAMRGNVLDLAIAVIIGGAFGKIVTSLVNDVIMPPIGLLLGKVNFTNLFITLSGPKEATLEKAQAAGAVTMNYGVCLNTIIDFLLIAFVVFLLVRWFTRLQAQPAPAPTAPTTKECPYCYSSISIKATRCPACTSEIT